MTSEMRVELVYDGFNFNLLSCMVTQGAPKVL